MKLVQIVSCLEVKPTQIVSRLVNILSHMNHPAKKPLAHLDISSVNHPSSTESPAVDSQTSIAGPPYEVKRVFSLAVGWTEVDSLGDGIGGRHFEEVHVQLVGGASS